MVSLTASAQQNIVSPTQRIARVLHRLETVMNGNELTLTRPGVRAVLSR
jgi:hypothetical protein